MKGLDLPDAYTGILNTCLLHIAKLIVPALEIPQYHKGYHFNFSANILLSQNLQGHTLKWESLKQEWNISH